MRYEPIDSDLVQEIIDGVHPHKDVEDIEKDLMDWSNFLATIIDYVKLVIAELKTFFSGE